MQLVKNTETTVQFQNNSMVENVSGTLIQYKINSNQDGWFHFKPNDILYPKAGQEFIFLAPSTCYITIAEITTV
jgi:hypothetical protein